MRTTRGKCRTRTRAAWHPIGRHGNGLAGMTRAKMKAKDDGGQTGQAGGLQKRRQTRHKRSAFVLQQAPGAQVGGRKQRWRPKRHQRAISSAEDKPPSLAQEKKGKGCTQRAMVKRRSWDLPAV